VNSYILSSTGAFYLNFNRYDMLCFEGIAMNLNVFLGNQSSPNYRLVPPPNGEPQQMIVHEPVSEILIPSV
jgi:phenylalanyl-tRNA synthetase beta chain